MIEIFILKGIVSNKYIILENYGGIYVCDCYVDNMCLCVFKFNYCGFLYVWVS